MTKAYVLTHRNYEERGHDGVSLIAVGDDVLALQEKAAELETERLREELEDDAIDELAPVANLAWSDWVGEGGPAGSVWQVAEVPWGAFHIEDVEKV